jgi:plasmid stabilization system protein ParE
VKIEWSASALADLDRFAAFLRETHPALSAIVGREIIAKAQVLSKHPRLGSPAPNRPEYRQLVMQVLNATYVFRYVLDGERVVMLRVFHSRENRA